MPRGQWAILLMLMLAAALTEGVGLLMLAPLLISLEPGAGSTLPLGPLGRWLGALELEELLALFVIVIGARAALVRARSIRTAEMEYAVLIGLRTRLHAALLHAHWGVSGQLARGALLSRLTTDVNWIGHGIRQIASLVATLVSAAIALLAAFALSPQAAFAMVAGAGVIALAYAGSQQASVRLGGRALALNERFLARLDEVLGALRLIKLHGKEAAEAEASAGLERDVADAVIAQTRRIATGHAALQLGGALVLALVVWLSMTRWGIGPYLLLPLIAVFARLLPLVGALRGQWEGWLYARPALLAVLETLGRMEAAREPEAGHLDPPAPQRSIALADAGYLHVPEDGRGIRRADCDLPVGTLTIITGPSGAGKSTLVDLLSGLLMPQQGALLLDGRVLGPAETLAWRRRVAYVQQHSLLFNATIRDNLLWATPHASDAQLQAALEAASAQFVFDWPMGLDTGVGDGGTKLSGGERQRIAIARCLLLDPHLLILDEPTSALDPESSAAVIAAIAALRGRLTIVAIAHGDALIAKADQVLRVEKGELRPARLP